MVIVNSNPFSRTRDDHTRELAEDYVELIYRLSEGSAPIETESCGEVRGVRTSALVEALRVAQPTVTKALTRLEQEDLVCIHPRQIVHLTAVGTSVARASLARHEDIVRFLVEIGVSPAQAEMDAEGIEHHVSSETLEAMRRVIESRQQTNNSKSR